MNRKKKAANVLHCGHAGKEKAQKGVVDGATLRHFVTLRWISRSGKGQMGKRKNDQPVRFNGDLDLPEKST
ncbi:MAG: hypothetical protein P8130_01035 [Deltaproteobacteria bacterium]